MVGPMRWVKVFFCFIDRWFVFVKRQDHNLIVHLVFKIALHSMHRKLIGWGNETAISCRTQVFNGFWMIINRPINCPTIACTCMRTELWFCTILILVHSVSRKMLYIWHTDGAKKKSECYERIRSSDSKTLRWTAPTTELVNESGESKHPVQMSQSFCIIKYSRISNVVCIHCRVMYLYVIREMIDFFNLVIEQEKLNPQF